MSPIIDQGLNALPDNVLANDMEMDNIFASIDESEILGQLEMQVVDSDDEQDSLESSTDDDERDYLESSTDDDDEHPHEKIYQGDFWKPNPDGSVSLKNAQMFIAKEVCVSAISDYAIQEGFSLQVIKNEGYRYTVKCKGEKCTWRLHASKLQDKASWAIKTLKGDHVECVRVTYNEQADHGWITQKLFEDVKANSNISVKAMGNLLMSRYGVQAHYWTIRRAKKKILSTIVGKDDDSYAMIPAYAQMIKMTNPGSIAFVNWNKNVVENPPFQRCFFAFKAMAEGFKNGCRKLIGLDGTHLWGPYKGVLLTALGLDGNNGCFPLAYAVVALENKNNWMYFLQGLVHVIGVENADQWCFITDKQKGILAALDKIFPQSKRRICYVHLERNFKKKWPSPQLKTLLYSACYAYTEYEWKMYMNQIKKISKQAHDWLMREPLQVWARHMFDKETKSDTNSTNFVESFNGVLKDMRGLNVNIMLEELRRKITSWYVDRSSQDEKWVSSVCPMVIQRLKDAKIDGRDFGLLYAGNLEFDINNGGTNFTVNLNTKTCDCQEWMISGIPCKHAIRCLNFMRLDPLLFVDDAYSVHKYKAAYKEIIHPIRDYKMWPDFSLPRLSPPIILKKAGRPRIERRRDSTEKQRIKRSTVLKCSHCHSLHHNKAGCTFQGHKGSQKKRKRMT